MRALVCDQTCRLWKDDPELSDGIYFKWVVDCCDGALGRGDTKKDEAVDGVGGRM